MFFLICCRRSPGYSKVQETRQGVFCLSPGLVATPPAVAGVTETLEGAFRPVPSPDGRWLVYATRYDARPALKIRDLASGEDRWLVMDVQRDDHQGGGSRDRDVYPSSAFTPDSRATSCGTSSIS